MSLHLLDTSVCVSLIRGYSSSWRLSLSESAISVITAAELEIGILKAAKPEKQRRAVAGLLELLPPALPVEASFVSHYGETRYLLERAGQPIGALDLLMAAHALALGAAVVTANFREFERVPGLSVVRWS